MVSPASRVCKTVLMIEMNAVLCRKFKGGRGPRSRGKLSRAGFPPSSRHNSRYGRGLEEDEFTESGISEMPEEITGLQRRLRG